MAGTVTVTKDRLKHPSTSNAGEKITVAWTSDASGDVSGTTIPMAGLLFYLVTVPSGTDAPTDNYDITLISPHGTALDVLQGTGANRDTTNTEQVAFCGLAALTLGSPVYVNGDYEFKVAAAGNAKSGQAIFYVVS